MLYNSGFQTIRTLFPKPQNTEASGQTCRVCNYTF